MDESSVKVDFKLRKFLNRTIPWPVLLLFHMLLLLVLLCFSFITSGFEWLYIQVGLILSSLLHFTFSHYEHGQKEVQLNGWKILLIALMTGSILFTPLLEQATEVSLVGLILTTVFFAGHVWWFVPRIKHMILTRTDLVGHLLATLSTSMVLMLAICLIRLGGIYIDFTEEPFFIQSGLFISLFVVLYVILRLLVFYLRQSPWDPEISESDHGALISENSDTALVEQHELLDTILKIENEFESNEVFLHKTFSLDMLAEKTQTSRHKLTYAFNQYYGKGFYRIVGEYRIRYALKILDHNQSLSLEALSEQCGFNSKSSFYKYFKIVNNCTPNQYLLKKAGQRNNAVS